MYIKLVFVKVLLFGFPNGWGQGGLLSNIVCIDFQHQARHPRVTFLILSFIYIYRYIIYTCPYHAAIVRVKLPTFRHAIGRNWVYAFNK